MYNLNNISEILNKYSFKSSNILKKLNIKVNIAGRIISKRIMGKSTFLNIQDIEGNIQIWINQNIITNIFYKKIKKIKLGDIIYISGKIFKTKTKVLTIKCTFFKILVNIYKYLPDKFHKIKNKETKFRKRYLDLIINKQTRKIFLTRTKIINLIKKYLNKNNYIEIETPILHNIPGGAIAKPFKTYHNKFNLNMYLRISPELYLKQLIIGGFTKIYELNKSFRNEGISLQHNPEFTMIEIYKAYSDYKDIMVLTENIFSYLINSLFKIKKYIKHKNKKIYFNIPFKKITMKKAIFKYSKLFKNIKDIDNELILNKIAKTLNINTTLYKGKIISKIFEITTEKFLIQPTFITEYPLDISPLAEKNNKKENIANRFELFINGYEIGNGFSELNNYKEQKIRFKQQMNNNINKNFFYNKEYINALKYGLPPTGGLGLGIDRIIMLLTNSTSIKEVILFPTLKQKN